MKLPSNRARTMAGLALVVACGATHAQAYRCDDGGRITYTNLPCPSGKQTEIKAPAAPTAAEQQAAEAGNRADQKRLQALDRQHALERKEDAKAAALAPKRDAGRDKEAKACAKLGSRARRAHEDYDEAAPRDRAARRTRMRRADDDFAALCKKRWAAARAAP